MSSPVCAMGSIGDKVEVEVEVAIDTRKDGLRLSREMSMMQTEGNGRDGEISWWTGAEMDDVARTPRHRMRCCLCRKRNPRNA